MTQTSLQMIFLNSQLSHLAELKNINTKLKKELSLHVSRPSHMIPLNDFNGAWVNFSIWENTVLNLVSLNYSPVGITPWVKFRNLPNQPVSKEIRKTLLCNKHETFSWLS